MLWDKSLNFDSWVKKNYMKEKLSVNDKKEIQKYIDKVKERKPLVGFEPLSPNLKRLKKYFSYLKHYFFCGRFRKDFIGPINVMFKWPSMPFKRILGQRYYSKYKSSDNYVYFPLNMWDDSAVACNAPEYFFQHNIVEKISKKMPKDMVLVVKEHPVMQGSTPLSWLKKISKIPNVKLVSPRINSHDIIKNCKLVIVVSSTVGWEAIIWQKPLIVFGNTFYSDLKYVTKANLNNLKQKIKEALSKKKDFKEIEHFINAMFKSDYPCYFFTPKMYFNLEKENIKRIADSFIDAVKYYYKK